MRLAPGFLGLVLVISISTMSGCTRYVCCSPAASPCAPTVTQGAVVRYGDVCQVPQDGMQGGNTIITQSPNRRVVIGDAPPPRVVVSEPGRSSNKGWRKADPESIATTRVEGGISSDSLNR